MASMLKETVSALKAGEMDFEGQSLAARIMWNGMSVAVIVAIISGSITRSFDTMVRVVTIAAVLIGLMIIPSWPIYRRNLLQWQPAAEEPRSDTEDAGDDGDDD
eukprot:Protomagalhaensia_sp_Gyna_25__3732@NODE_3352_length_611_cov_188_062937_g2810_i0_p1_GENE_NODE_3352_length_611_cov_188_062937_g2810_i0NODE_3352_length_611_cov_188_062937_g2810_i0_p1_ORF_typecomplete_len104_score6_89SPC12/PF06645_13/5_9e19PUCC/PF03209_15/0_012DUF4335/PF14233_6/0_21_NODE_3352_length_611_cov_188_062937_g2810_i0131442